jgi:nucleoside 2-deoxyribosyltransferase
VTSLTVVGGVYHERCIWPEWNQVYGSAGRAAAALSGHVDAITLHCYATPETEAAFRATAALYGLNVIVERVEQALSFEYVHALSNPTIRPSLNRLRANPPFRVTADHVLRFGMLEGTAIVEADRCVYDPQSAFDPEPFNINGSRAANLAIVGNRSEIIALGGAPEPIDAAKRLVAAGAAVVVVKSGPLGAIIVDGASETQIPAFQSERVWSIGSGDVFAAFFTSRWGVHRDDPRVAADLASKAVAAYAETMALPAPSVAELSAANRAPAVAQRGRVYLASPFFTIGQRWLVDEAREALRGLGLEVFSPVHDVGPGPAEEVAPADLAALAQCDRVLAILDGLDSGTLFEVGHARAQDLPVYALAQAVSLEDLKMVVGSGCKVFDDFVTAIYHASWKT